MREISDFMRHCFLGLREIVIILAKMSHWLIVSYCDRWVSAVRRQWTSHSNC